MWSTIGTYAFVTELSNLHWYFAMSLLNCCLFHTIAFIHLFCSDPCLNHRSDIDLHIHLHPLFILCSPLVPNFIWSSDHTSAFFFSKLYVCECQSILSGALQNEHSQISFPVLFFSAYLSLCTSEIYNIIWTRCHSAFVIDFFKPRYGKFFLNTHTYFLIHFFLLKTR